MLKKLLRWLLVKLYGFRAFNETVLQTPGPVLLLPNHVSWLDWLFLGVCLDDDWRFVTSSLTAETSWLHKRIMVNRRTFPINMNSPYAAKHMAEYLQKGGRLVLFPEGRISYTGSLMKLYEGTGFLLHRTRSRVITAFIRGAYRLPFSRNPDKHRWFPRISVHFSEILQPPGIDHLPATAARARLTNWTRDMLVALQFQVEMEVGPRTVNEAIAETARRHRGKVILKEASWKDLSYRRLLAGGAVIGEALQARVRAGDSPVGVLLPNVNAFPVTLFSLWQAGLVPAVLNYTTGVQTMLTCCRVAGIKQIVSSRRFIEQMKFDPAAFSPAGVELILLEDIGASVSALQRLGALARASFGGNGSNVFRGPDAEKRTAIILFTSGSEGEPKAVELTHANVLANIRQMLSVIDVTESDRFFNALPLFHSFGLTVGLLLPLIRGSFVFLYLSPLHYRVVPAALYDLRCTVFFGTNTFLSGYARKAHPCDFLTVRYLFAGAEKLQESTTKTWSEKFGVRVLEGYGATECSPCVSANLPTHPCPGSAGQFLPGIEHRIEPVEGVPEGGRLFVRGPNIMRGYLNPEPNAKFQALNGWYDTGDIAKVDDHGFVYILGRLKRFAKVSGEMVSLGAVEDALATAFPQYGPKFTIAVISRPDPGKGEKLIAITNDPRLTPEDLREAVRSRGLSNLSIPREIRVLHEIPRLGTGKINYRELEKLAQN
jgi:acyl-[acyl-carrier-protein]-phospholipid O-acyltransferase/long-chain-fatty-acid--[acyl-carrier-protein] ligase